MIRPITLSLILSLAACTGDEENPTSASTTPTTVFEENRPVVDTDWPEIGDTDGDADTDTDTDSDTDTDTDTDSDTDTDTGTPADTDTATPPDTDTATPPDTDTGGSSSCTATFEAEVRTTTGTVCGTTSAACDSTAELVVVGRAVNHCSVDVVVESTTDCLVSSYSIEDLSGGTGTGMGASCSSTPTSWTILPGEYVEETATWGTQPVGSYRMTASFYDAATSSAQTLFDIK